MFKALYFFHNKKCLGEKSRESLLPFCNFLLVTISRRVNEDRFTAAEWSKGVPKRRQPVIQV
jgi:hypothetical protein